MTVGYGTAGAVTAATATYTSNGLQATLADGRGSLTTYEYDGFDRLRKIRYPNPSSSGSSTTDYEEFTYDSASRITQVRRRDAATIGYSYDNLGRLTTLNLPGSEPDVSYTYDLLNRQLTAGVTGRTITNTYDGLGRVTSVGDSLSGMGTVSYQYDAAGNRTRITWPDSYYASYEYDTTGAVTHVRENGATSGAGVLAVFTYDNLGRRTQVSRADSAGATTTYSYDDVSRLSSLTQNLSGSSDDLTLSFTYSPASEILTRVVSDTDYLSSPSSSSVSYSANNLNQYTSVGGTSQTYDSRGNLTGDSSRTLAFDSLNRLTSVSAPTAVALAYDPYGRLGSSTASSTETRYLYDGVSLVAELNTSGTVLRRYVPGPGLDETLVWYEGSGTSDRRWLLADNQGTIVAYAGSSAALGATYNYGPFGDPTAWTGSRMRYTGQPMIPEANLYYYRARVYDAGIGRFLQPDPIGTAGGINLYSYASGDPINLIDPSGTTGCIVNVNCPTEVGGLTVVAERPPPREDPIPSWIWNDFRDTVFTTPWDDVTFNQTASARSAQHQQACPVVSPGNVSDGLLPPHPGSGISELIGNQAGLESRLASERRFPSGSLRNNAADAWRHFRWNYAMTQRMGAARAQNFANRYELDHPNPPAETRMDLRNNAMGRAFAESAYGLRRTPDEAADLALDMGCLQTAP